MRPPPVSSAGSADLGQLVAVERVRRADQFYILVLLLSRSAEASGI
jgi:hypothetical protein